MPSYKLTYFKNKGRAEVARMLFTLAGEKFEDNRLTPEEWAELKPSENTHLSLKPTCFRTNTDKQTRLALMFKILRFEMMK